ncbi:uncharacterized protein LOC131666835 [Phymastichus coffea]|uniref:uncharacterized protein LOC131666835 n=1 Tax=Phymastichus coffea TaxID=108790 RepID=UPI00273BDB7F|nr:uncharacterized protein LOC131666835 [Phymastichus coffea]
MLRMKITTAVFYYISQLYYVCAIVKIQQRQLEFTKHELIFGHESFKDGKLTYAVCKSNVTSNEKLCIVTREKEPFSNNTLSCNVTLKILAMKSNDREIEESIGLVPFAGDKAILYVVQKYRRTKVKFNTIQFHGCNVIETHITVSKFVFSKYNIMVIPYSNSYDVVYPSTSKGFQKITINLNGERINGPIDLGYFLWLVHFPYILPISQKSRRKGFVYLSFVLDSDCPDGYNLNVWKPDGSGKIIGRHTIALRSLKATEHDLVSICHDDGNYSLNFVKCTQYDIDGNLKFQTDSIGTQYESILFIYNAPGGGLFLFSGKSKNETEDIDFFIAKLDPAGKNNGFVSIGKIKLKAEALVTSFYKIGDSEYCISLVDYNAFGMTCLGRSNPYYIDQTIGCFNDSDFSI